MSLRSAKGAVRAGWVAAAPARAQRGALVKGRRASSGLGDSLLRGPAGGVSRARHILALPSPVLAARGEADGVHFKVSSRALTRAAAGKGGAGALCADGQAEASTSSRPPVPGLPCPRTLQLVRPVFPAQEPPGRGASLRLLWSPCRGKWAGDLEGKQGCGASAG